MVVKEKFVILKDIPNIIDISSSTLSAFEVDNGMRKVFVVLELIKTGFSHYTKNTIFKLVGNVKKRELIKIANIPNYILPVTYNTKTNNIIINIQALGYSDIDVTKINPKDLYAAILYGYVFYSIISKNFVIKTEYFQYISNFLISIFIRLFGKAYGLLGIYSTEISKLKFLIGCYILSSFFEIKNQNTIYKLSSVYSKYDIDLVSDKIGFYDFTNIKDFIRSLDELKVMPGINENIFVSRMYGMIGYGFMPALEDLARFFSIIISSSVPGAKIVPGFIKKYNETEYVRILEISHKLFKQ